MRARPEVLPQQTEHCIWNEAEQLATWLCEHGHNLKEGLLEKSKLAQHAYEDGQRVPFDEARIFGTERNN
jgi:hypothetical protein